MIHKKVKFEGEIYWLHELEDGGYNLSPLEHYTDSGELDCNPLVDISYAVIEGDVIFRYRERIGVLSDLEDV